MPVDRRTDEDLDGIVVEIAEELAAERHCLNCFCIEDDHFELDWYFVGMLEDPTQANQCGDCGDCHEPEFEPTVKRCPGCNCPESAHDNIDPYWVWLSRGALSELKGCADCGASCDPDIDQP